MSQISMTTPEIVERMREDIANKITMVKSGDGYRYYTDVLTQTTEVIITTPQETAEQYYKVFINPIGGAGASGSTNAFDNLPRVSMYIGQPDTGKTYKAQEVAKSFGIEPLIKMCRDSLNLETLLEDFILVDGKPVFQESLAIKMLSGTDKAIIVLDEFNTLLTGVMKTLQPIFDDTSTTFEYRGKVYNKNLNCKFIVTLNDKDKGISIVPDAILSRAYCEWFEAVPTPMIAKWTGSTTQWVQSLRDIYKICKLDNVFGTRQVKIIKQLGNQVKIKNHLMGLCRMKNIDDKVVDTLQVKNLIANL